jgi:molybdopterin/thiamine biosynthesis adenylyltransferase
MPAASGSGRLSYGQRFIRSIQLILYLLFIALPCDVYTWLRPKRKSITDKLVLVTGGAMGIGQRVAELLAVDHRARVIIIDIDSVSCFN